MQLFGMQQSMSAVQNCPPITWHAGKNPPLSAQSAASPPAKHCWALKYGVPGSTPCVAEPHEPSRHGVLMSPVHSEARYHPAQAALAAQLTRCERCSRCASDRRYWDRGRRRHRPLSARSSTLPRRDAAAVATHDRHLVQATDQPRITGVGVIPAAVAGTAFPGAT